MLRGNVSQKGYFCQRYNLHTGGQMIYFWFSKARLPKVRETDERRTHLVPWDVSPSCSCSLSLHHIEVALAISYECKHDSTSLDCHWSRREEYYLWFYVLGCSLNLTSRSCILVAMSSCFKGWVLLWGCDLTARHIFHNIIHLIKIWVICWPKFPLVQQRISHSMTVKNSRVGWVFKSNCCCWNEWKSVCRELIGLSNISMQQVWNEVPPIALLRFIAALMHGISSISHLNDYTLGKTCSLLPVLLRLLIFWCSIEVFRFALALKSYHWIAEMHPLCMSLCTWKLR